MTKLAFLLASLAYAGIVTPQSDSIKRTTWTSSVSDPNPFVDPHGYRTYVERLRQSYRDQLARERVQAPLDRTNKPISYVLPGVPQPFTRSTYEYRTEPQMQLDVYRPTALSAPGVVILVHGSAPATADAGPKDWEFFRSYGARLAESGLTVVVPNHRLGTDMPHPDDAEADLQAVLRFLAQDHGRAGIDARSMAIVLFSGAGVLAAPILRGSMGVFTAVALMYPTLDARMLAPYVKHVPTTMRALYVAVDVIASSDFRRVPMFVGRGGRDKQAGVNQSVDAFIRSALSANLDLAIHNVAAGDHGFDNGTDDAEVMATIDALISFLKRHLASRLQP